MAAAPGGSSPAERAVWRRQDGQMVGGWRWLKGASGESQLLLFLGPEPPQVETMANTPADRPAPGELVLQVRPRALEALALLPPEMPLLVRRSDQLVLRTFPQGQGRFGGGGFSLLSGALQLPR
jgi:hypothetical protein